MTEECKHLRTGGTRLVNGFDKVCLACGYEWFVEDKPKTDAEKEDRKRFDLAQKLGENK